MNYEKAVAGQIEKMLGIQEQVLKKNAASIEKSWRYFNWKYVKNTVPYLFVVGDVVLMNVKQRLSDLKNIGVHWIGLCTIVYERPGKLYDIEYECRGQVFKYLRVHPKFLKLYLDQVV